MPLVAAENSDLPTQNIWINAPLVSIRDFLKKTLNNHQPQAFEYVYIYINEWK